jgi:hypothetical protein
MADNRFAESVLSAAEGFKPPPLVLPRVAGEDEGEGLNDLNGWNILNGYRASKMVGYIRAVCLTASSISNAATAQPVDHAGTGW